MQNFNALEHGFATPSYKATLTYYDHTKPVVIQKDASEYSLHAALIQNGRPKVITSKTLTDVETRYTNIKRECLSICFGLKYFHVYIN